MASTKHETVKVDVDDVLTEVRWHLRGHIRRTRQWVAAGTMTEEDRLRSVCRFAAAVEILEEVQALGECSTLARTRAMQEPTI